MVTPDPGSPSPWGRLLTRRGLLTRSIHAALHLGHTARPVPRAEQRTWRGGREQPKTPRLRTEGKRGGLPAHLGARSGPGLPPRPHRQVLSTPPCSDLETPSTPGWCLLQWTRPQHPGQGSRASPLGPPCTGHSVHTCCRFRALGTTPGDCPYLLHAKSSPQHLPTLPCNLQQLEIQAEDSPFDLLLTGVRTQPPYPQCGWPNLGNSSAKKG